MKEKEKIKNLIKNHKAILKATDMDVAESMKGQWFFTRYNKENDYYDALIRFETADELAEIILGELASDIFATIERDTSDIEQGQNLADDLELHVNYAPHIERLLAYLGK